MTASSFNQFLSDLQTSGLPELFCILAQIWLSIIIMYNLFKHSDRFPIKQLSPYCTIAAVISFALINVVSMIARGIEQNNEYYSFKMKQKPCGQCRIFEHKQMQALALIYMALREFPLIVFSLKTLRVSLCFLQYKQKELPRWIQILFGNQARIILLSVFYSILVGLANYADLHIGSSSLTAYSAQFTFQFLCPKQSGVVDWIVNLLRYVIMAIAYYTNFKRFLFLIFMLANTQIIVRIIIVSQSIQNKTYHQFYYHSLILNFIGTLMMYPYSKYNLYVQQPPGTAILQNFDAFINYTPGRNILQFYAVYRDQNIDNKRYAKSYQAYLEVSHIKKLVTLDNTKLSQCYSVIEDIINTQEIDQKNDVRLALTQKISQRNLQLSDIKKLQKRLGQFCLTYIFTEWKKTESELYIKQEFKRNMIIDEMMNSVGIQIGS